MSMLDQSKHFSLVWCVERDVIGTEGWGQKEEAMSHSLNNRIFHRSEKIGERTTVPADRATDAIL